MATATPGCSLLFVTRPPDTHLSSGQSKSAEQAPQCTTSKVAPAIDTAIAGYQIFRTGVAATADDSQYVGAPIGRDADIAFGLAFTALFLTSAIYGYTTTSQCSTLVERHRQSVAESAEVEPHVGAEVPVADADDDEQQGSASDTEPSDTPTAIRTWRASRRQRDASVRGSAETSTEQPPTRPEPAEPEQPSTPSNADP